MSHLNLNSKFKALSSYASLRSLFNNGFLRQIDKYLQIKHNQYIYLHNSYYMKNTIKVIKTDYVQILDFFVYPITLELCLEKLRTTFGFDYSRMNSETTRNFEQCVDTIRTLAKQKFIVRVEHDEFKMLVKLRRAAFSNLSFPSQVYIISSQKCNFRCPDCRIYAGDWKRKNSSHTMTTPVFDKQLRFVLKMLPPNPKKYTDVNFTFYGGEPLLNKTLIEHSAAKIRYLEKSLRFKSFRFSLALITNGSLINKATIQLVKEYDINIAVSLDGYGEAHDVQRRFINGKGTFKRVLRGLECLNENNVPFALSWTIGPKNIDETPRSIRWLASTFDNPKIAFNIVMGTSPEVHPFKHVGYKSFFKKMHKIYDTLQKLGLKEGRIARYKQWSLSGCLPYLFYCNALGDGALVLLPNGKIGICHAGIMNNEIQFQLPQRIKDPFEDPIFLNWIGKTTLFKKTCYQGCNYFSLCPGGCAYRIQELTGDINAVTDEVCMVEKFLIERAVIEVADHMYG